MSKKRKQQSPRTLADALRRHAGRRTVLGVAIPILTAHVAAARIGEEFFGLAPKLVEAGFRELCGKYLHSQFHTTYLDRPLGPRGFLFLDNGLYRFRPTLLDGLSIDDLDDLRRESVASLQDAAEQRRAAINRLQGAYDLPLAEISEREQLVKKYLQAYLGNNGENFEIISFAILREYFESFGFQLLRFSTTHANDGGMDFFGGNSIYQVSSNESLQKLESDLMKAPDRDRVIVRPHMTPDLLRSVNEHVLESIDLADLLAHFVGWLIARDHRCKKATHLQGVLETALAEFRREERAETLTAS
jgi:hypothetical protein